ncbi:hypothetical protein [Streptomyces monomycini]|uniref:hypothetical protein n=1 Tax=Streptomyces monomycini TaxID=371720 RepID=UPI0004AADC5E|nr:hypothetical protein [Streptomyces monomycini]
MIKNGHRTVRRSSTSEAPAFHGEFETHLTVRDTGTEPGPGTGTDPGPGTGAGAGMAPGAAAGLEEYAAARGLKWVHIVLERGTTPSQPMLTLRDSGPVRRVRARAAAEAAQLRAAGFEVVRTKIEATPWTDGVPVTDGAAAALGPGYYFEHHVKLLLDRAGGAAAHPCPALTDLTDLTDLSRRHAAHLSRNARRTRADGREERFVTQRCRSVGRVTAERRLAALLAGLRDAGYDIASTEREFVVLDSDESLDDGWIDEKHGV